MAEPLGSTCRCMIGGAVLAAARCTRAVVEGLRELQDGLQGTQETKGQFELVKSCHSRQHRVSGKAVLAHRGMTWLKPSTNSMQTKTEVARWA